MSLHLLKADTPLYIAAENETGHGASQHDTGRHRGWHGILVKTAERTVNGISRYYYTALGPQRVLIVKSGEPLESLDQEDMYIQAWIGWDEGTPGLVLPQNEGKRHIKLGLGAVMALAEAEAAAYAGLYDTEVESLAALLASAPRDEGTNGERPKKPRRQRGR
jgi:hypothetical protein